MLWEALTGLKRRMKTASESACSPKDQTGLHPTWGRTYHTYDSSTHRIPRSRRRPEQAVVEVEEVGSSCSEALGEAAAVACLGVALREILLGSQPHPQTHRWGLLGRPYRLAHRTPALVGHNDFEMVMDNS